MRVLVTGAGGFVGANLTRAWTEAGHEVHATTAPGGDRWRLDGVDATLREVDLTDTETVSSLLTTVKPEVVVNAAAHGAYSWQTDVDRMAAVNVVATAALVDAALTEGVDRFVHLGSSSEYGFVDHAPTETERVAPNSLYAVTKAAGTHVVADAVRRRGLPGVTLRLYAVYGPWEEPGRLMPTVAWWALNRGLPPKLVDRDVARDFVHVDDVRIAIESLVSSSLSIPEPFVLNIGSGRQSTIAELVELVRSEFGITAEPRWGTMPRRRWDTHMWQADPTRARTLLGWEPAIDMATGLRSMVAFVSAHADRYRPSGD